jgi:hypothetical protein
MIARTCSCSRRRHPVRARPANDYLRRVWQPTVAGEAAKPVRVFRMGQHELAGIVDAEPRQFIMLMQRHVDWLADPLNDRIQMQHHRLVGAWLGRVEVSERTPCGWRDADLLLKLSDQSLLA